MAIGDVFVEIGERIRTAREERGWTQAQLGEAIGYTQATIGNYELGRRHIGIDDLYKISDALGKPYAYFIGADRQLEDQAKQEAEGKVRRDMAAFVGVRMMPVLSRPVAIGARLSPADIDTTIPVPREFCPRADVLVYVSATSDGSDLRKGDYVFVRRQEPVQVGQVVLCDVAGNLDLATCSADGRFLSSQTGEPLSERIAIVGEYCGLFTERRFAPSVSGKVEQSPAGWTDLRPGDRLQVEQFIAFLKARRSGDN